MNQIRINLANLKYNVQQIKKLYPEYKYYMAVVKSEAYGLGIEAIKVISEYCNYLVVSNTKEAIAIRKEKIETPILVLEPIQAGEINLYTTYHLTATIDSIETIEAIKNYNIRVHMKIDTGMNRFGFSNQETILKAYQVIENSQLVLEGIYTHLYCVDNKIVTNHQMKLFEDIVKKIPYVFPIIHIFNSQALSECEKLEIANGVRIGDLLYGLTEHQELQLKSTFTLQTNITSIRHINKGQTVGYDGLYKAEKDIQIAILPIGYSQGLTKNHIGTNVYIHNKPYPIIGNTMNQTFIKIDDTIHGKDVVDIYKDTFHLIELSKQLNTVPQELMLIIDKNMDKGYIKSSE